MKLHYCTKNKHYTLKEECHEEKTIRKARNFKVEDKHFHLRETQLRTELMAIPCLTLKHSHNQPSKIRFS